MLRFLILLKRKLYVTLLFTDGLTRFEQKQMDWLERDPDIVYLINNLKLGVTINDRHYPTT